MPRREPKFSRKLFIDICAEVAEGDALTKVLAKEGRPAMSTFFLWLDKADNAESDKDPYWCLDEAYARAIEARNQVRADRMLEEANTPRIAEIVDIEYETVRAYKEDEKGRPIPDPDHPGEFLIDFETHKSGWKMIEKSRKVKHVDSVDRSRLAVDTEKWALSKMQPRARGTGRFGYGNNGPSSIEINTPGSPPTSGTVGITINLINAPSDPAGNDDGSK